MAEIRWSKYGVPWANIDTLEVGDQIEVGVVVATVVQTQPEIVARRNRDGRRYVVSPLVHGAQVRVVTDEHPPVGSEAEGRRG